MKVNECTGRIINAAMRVHTRLGPGLLESAYSTCVAHELRRAGFDVRREVSLPLVYEGLVIDCGYRLDMVVEGIVVVELKAVQTLLPVHSAQLLSYLRLGTYPAGLLINFHEPHLKDGIKRMVNGA